MSIEATIYSTLTTDATVAGLVGSGSPTVYRVYPNLAPDGVAVPYVTYELVAYTSYDYVSGAPTAHRKVFQINCISDDFDEAKTLVEAARSALEGVGYMQSAGDDYYPETQRHRCRMDFALIAQY